MHLRFWREAATVLSALPPVGQMVDPSCPNNHKGGRPILASFVRWACRKPVPFRVVLKL